MHFTGWEKALAGFVIAWLLLLHLCCFSSAGALWRDEANSVQQSQLPGWAGVWNSLRFDSFPALYPSLLRLWCSSEWGRTDHGLRFLGLLTGLCILCSLWIAGRRAGGRMPLVSLILFAADPILVSEGDSIRPYGISILFLIWTFVFFMEYLTKPAALVLAGASLAAVLAVQSGYANAPFVAVLSLCAAGVALRQGERRGLWFFFVPGFAAAVSLIPYARVLHQAQGWAAILHSNIDWNSFFESYLRAHSTVYPLVWAGFSLLAMALLVGHWRDRPGTRLLQRPLTVFVLWTALASSVVQILFVEVIGVPPFPRYFLPGALLVALACEALLAPARPAIRVLAVSTALLVTAAPTWSWLTQRHTNVDSVAAVLEREAGPEDLVVISPWFLHPSFQRYYRGGTEWITVPELDHFPMMRYDLVKNAILYPDASDRLELQLRNALAREGAIWFVSQRVWTNLDRREAPERPPVPVAPDGADYVRFRSYWERDIEYRLRACCRRIDVPVSAVGRVCDEEDLVLTRWERR